MTEDVRKLLGGYATGTLTEEEKQTLYAAALSDDELFAALADEQALKDLLDDGAVRAQLLQATENPRFSISGAFREWFERPKSKALAGTAVVLLVLIGVRAARETKPIGPGSSSEVAVLRRLPPTSDPPVTNRTQSAGEQQPRRETKPNVKKEGDSAQGEFPLSPAPPPPPPKAEVAESVVVTRASAGNTGAVAGVGSASTPVMTAAPAAAPPPPPPPASLARSDFRSADAARPPSTTAPAPAGMQTAAAGPFERASGTTAVPLRYELLRRDAAGAFQPVPIDYEFADGDVVRVRVNSTHAGTVVFGVAGLSPKTGGTAANVWATFPQTDDGIVIGPETRTLVLRFTPLEAAVSSFANATATSPVRAGGGVNVEIPLRRKAR
jgi:hypothetical protein